MTVGGNTQLLERARIDFRVSFDVEKVSEQNPNTLSSWKTSKSRNPNCFWTKSWFCRKRWKPNFRLGSFDKISWVVSSESDPISSHLEAQGLLNKMWRDRVTFRRQTPCHYDQTNQNCVFQRFRQNQYFVQKQLGFTPFDIFQEVRVLGFCSLTFSTSNDTLKSTLALTYMPHKTQTATDQSLYPTDQSLYQAFQPETVESHFFKWWCIHVSIMIDESTI